MILSVIFALFATPTPALAATDLANFAQTKAAFENASAPKAKDLESALWMATSIASSPQIRGGLSGRFQNGKIPSEPNQFVRQIARIDIASNGKAEMKITTTDADYGTLVEEIRHYGELKSKGLKLEAAGDAQTCATQSLCRTLSDKTLLCAQISNDSRRECTRSYKKGTVSSYLGYSPVHP